MSQIEGSNDVLREVVAHLHHIDVRIVLSGDHYGANPPLVPTVLDGDLGLSVGPKVRKRTVAPHRIEPGDYLSREVQRKGEK